jgi:hypothetical protein
MVVLGKNTIKYMLDGKSNEVLITVELIQNTDCNKLRQNIYNGVALVDGQEFTELDLNYYVNAQFAADDIVKFIIEKLTIKHGNLIKFKTNKKSNIFQIT